MRLLFKLVLVIFLFSPLYANAKQSSTGDIENTCEISGGEWHGSESGNWACCWADWGCYGCVNGVCKIKCYNARCRRANGMSRVGPGEQRVKGLAPAGMSGPIVPKVKSSHAH